MMTTRAIALFAGLVVQTSVALAASCPNDTKALVNGFIAAYVEDAPSKAAKATEATGTSSASATSNVNSPERPAWLALAIEQGVAKENASGGVTLSLSPFHWLEELSVDGRFDDNGEYVETKGLRRLTGSLSLGNRGEAIDTDGDGSPEDPLDAKSLGDSVQLELQYQFYGSRDRRDIVVMPEYVSRIKGVERDVLGLARAFNGIMGTSAMDDLENDLERVECAVRVERLVQAVKNDPILNAQVIGFLSQGTALGNHVDQMVSEIDSSWVWSAAVSALERETYLGRDQLGLSLRGLKGITTDKMFKGSTFVFELDYAKVESLVANQKDLRAATLGVKYVSPFESLGLGNGEPARWTVSLTGEKNWNAPDGAKKSQATLGWSMELPISKDVSVPISIKWSNRDELLRDEDEVVGHVGISLNFDSLLGKGGS